MSGLSIIIAGFILFLLIVFVIELFRQKRLKNKKGEDGILVEPEPQNIQTGCCGQHEFCEKFNQVNKLDQPVEYFDDEELDEYKKITSNAYTPEAITIFRDIFYTMHPEDIAGWLHSLRLREIELPDELKDEVYMILNAK